MPTPDVDRRDADLPAATPAALPPATLRRWRRRLADEQAEVALYRNLAGRRGGEERDILLGIAEAEERHAAHWRRLLGGRAGRSRTGGVRTRLLARLARRYGSVFVLALAQQAEHRAAHDQDADATPAMAADERVHAEVLRGLAARGRAQVSGTFRAAVFGANDGLVSNLALVLGVTGGGAATRVVLLTGLAGLLAGALSMGAGEYISVRSQRELLAASTPGEGAGAVVRHLDVDANELALVYRARGMPAEEARRRADALLGGHAGEPPAELPGHPPDPSGERPGGVEGHDVVGSAVGAALSSSCFFACGAAVPVLPFLLGLEGVVALLVAGVLVGAALLLTGAVVGVMSGGPPLRRGLRQLAIGAGAAAVSYGLGLLFDATVG